MTNYYKIFIFVLLLSSLHSVANAITVEEYEEIKILSVEIAETYMHGVIEGIDFANLYIENENCKIYCLPPKLTLNTRNAMDILENKIDEYRKNKVFGDDLKKAPIELLLLKGLEETFPCKK
jgi:hypothetical protein